jgi:enterochelin esterase-like enzyme
VAGPLDWSLIDGTVPTLVLTGGAVATVALLADRDRSWWTWKAPAALGAAVGLAILTGIVVDKWWKPFPDSLPTEVLAWIGVGVLGLALLIARFAGLGWKGRTGAVFGALVLVTTAASQINRYYQQYPTLRAALGPWISDSVDFSKVSGKNNPDTLVTAPAGKMLADVWKAPAGIPENGTISSVKIPPTASGFSARDAWVYLPPSYHVTPRPQLPLLVMLSGQPGSPRDWIDALGMQQTLDSYAAAHQGLAPVVLMPDATGSAFGNPLCLDSKLGRSETYLTTDVKNWVVANLQVAAPSKGWSVVGYSYGGTCSLQLAVRDPELYPTFVDISGQREPTLGSRSETVQAAFGGDAAAFAKVNPLDILAVKKFPTTFGVILVGADDGKFTPQQRDVFQACQTAGMHVQWVEVPGGHTAQVWRAALAKELPWIAERNGLARQ